MPGLRDRKLGRYACLVFYMESDACIDVRQILHAGMDILTRLREPDALAEDDESDA